MKALRKWLGKIPHLFSKAVVAWCVLFGSGCCAYALRIMEETGNDPAALLSVVLAFLGGELILLFGRDALKGKEKKGRDEDAGISDE